MTEILNSKCGYPDWVLIHCGKMNKDMIEDGSNAIAT
jgi:hypothetical protein